MTKESENTKKALEKGEVMMMMVDDNGSDDD